MEKENSLLGGMSHIAHMPGLSKDIAVELAFGGPSGVWNSPQCGQCVAF